MDNKKTYLTLSYGKVTKGSGKEKQYFNYLEGCIENIYSRITNLRNAKVVQWYIDLRKGGEVYSLCFRKGSEVFRSIILSLASQGNLTTSTLLRIEPYRKTRGGTGVGVYVIGKKLKGALLNFQSQDKERMEERSRFLYCVKR